MAERALREPQPERRHGEPERQLAQQRQLGLLGALRREFLRSQKEPRKLLLSLNMPQPPTKHLSSLV